MAPLSGKPRQRPPRVTFLAPSDDEFKKRLMDEYKILQDKIDKIGGFRSTIKGWSVTIVIAAAAATSSNSNLLTVIVISAGLAVMLSFFCKFEYEQVKLSRLFGDRARVVEETFRSLDRFGQAAQLRTRTPFTAHEIVQASRRQKWADDENARKFGDSARGRVKSNWSKWRNRWPVVKQSDFFFYVVLISLAFLLLLVPRYKTIYTHPKHRVSEPRQSDCPPSFGGSPW
jgi:hypothetical protein